MYCENIFTFEKFYLYSYTKPQEIEILLTITNFNNISDIVFLVFKQDLNAGYLSRMKMLSINVFFLVFKQDLNAGYLSRMKMLSINAVI
jgi:hypothetical protein